MKIIKAWKCGTIYTRFYKINNMTFKFVYDNCEKRPISPIKIDSRFRADISISDDGLKWKCVADKTMINFEPIEYWKSEYERIEDSEVFFEKMRNHIYLAFNNIS